MTTPINTSTIVRDEVLEVIRGAIMAQVSSITPEQLTDESVRLVQDLSFDSLDCIELLLNIESLLGIEIPDDNFEDSQSEITIGQMADMAFELIVKTRPQ